jgi:hypothetical protein
VILHTSWDVDNSVTIDYTNIQLELGSTATTYEPYTDSTLYIADNEEVRSVPAISDEVKVVNGQLVKVQNVSEPTILDGSLGWTEDYSGTLTYRFVIPSLPNATISTSGRSLETNADAPYIASLSIGSDIRLYCDRTDLGYFYLRVEKTKVDAMSGTTVTDKFKTYLNLYPITLFYTLVTPLTTPLLTSGILQAKPNGTVYFEPYYEGSHQTDASSEITLPYEGTIDKLTGYDENLEPYEVPSTAYTLVGTLLTITGAVENEVFYVELSRTEPLAPELIVNTLNNDQVTLDSADGKYYQIGFTTTNGVPTVTATEVL